MQSLLISSINMFFRVIYYIITIRILLSWLRLGENPISTLIYNITEPILGPIRRMIDKSPIGGGMMLDFSPVIALFVLELIKNILISLIRMF